MRRRSQNSIKNLIPRLLITLLVTVFQTLPGNAQSSVIIGTDNYVSVFPLNTYSDYTVTEMVYLNSEIGDGSAKLIEKLAFQRADVAGAVNVPNVRIYLKNSADATLSTGTYSTYGYSLVYSGTYPVSASTGWKEVTLQNSFMYNGIDNLHVLVVMDESYSLTWLEWYFSSTAYDYRTRYNYSDDFLPTTLTEDYGRPNIRMTYSAAPAMTYSSSTTSQNNTSAVKVGSTDQVVIGIEVVTSGVDAPVSITNFNFTTTGTTSSGEISNARVYSTGTSTAFATSTQFGSTVASPNGSFSVTGSQTLSMGTNYFWLTYDISPGATDEHLIDATCEQITVAGVEHTPSVTSPAGARMIRTPLTGTRAISATGGKYSTLGAAIEELNYFGVAPGGVTFTLADGETFNESPTIRITQTGSEDDPVVIRQSGSGTKPVLRFTGTVNVDTCIKLSQVGNITIDGLQIVDAMATNKVEYGIYLHGTGTAGSRNNIIKNCLIDLEKTNTSSIGIFVNSTATSEAGTNSHNKFYNNTVQDCYSGYYFNGNSTYHDTGNEVGTLPSGASTVTNLGGSSAAVYGVRLACQQNFVLSNTTISYLSGAAAIYGVHQGAGSGNSVTFTSNDLNNISGTSSSSIYGIYITAGNSASIANNEIHAMSTATSRVYGMSVSGVATSSISKNKIHNIHYTGSNIYIAFGLDYSGGTSGYIFNNLIYDISAPASYTFTENPGVQAISVTGNGDIHLFNNSVLVEYTSTAANHWSSALRVGFVSNLVMNNNIFVNRTDVTTGSKSVAFYHSTDALNTLSAGNNNNLFYAGAPGTKNLIFYNRSASYRTLAEFKAKMGVRESESVTENPPYVSSTDLHIDPATPTQIESGGRRITSPIAITDDFEGNIRQGEAGYAGTGTAPDIGAYEGDFIPLDISPPVISYALLGNSSATPVRVFENVSITDRSGVNVTPGTAPRVYYKKSTDLNAFAGNTSTDNGWKWIESSSGSSPFSFAIDYGILNGGGASPGDVIQYFVAAQDMNSTPNVGVNSGFPNGTPLSVNLQPENAAITGTINSYTVVLSISGTKTIGASGADYASIGAAINAVSAAELSGPVVLNLIDAAYNESVTIPVLTGISSTNTLTIKPAPGTTVIWTSNTNTSGTLRINGADFVIIDGSNNGTTSRDMTIANTDLEAFSTPVWISSLGTGAGSTNITVKNCNLQGGSGLHPYAYGIFAAGQTLSETGTGDDNDNLTIQNNVITKVYTGIYAKASSAGVNNGLVISGNTIGSSSSEDHAGDFGMDLAGANGASVTNNTIFNLGSYLPGPTGILIGTGFVSSTINANRIHGLHYTGEDGYGARGIEINTGSASSALTISNNLIYDLTGNGSDGYLIYAIVGIRIAGNTGGVNVWHNSVNLYGNISRPSATGDKSAAIYIATTVTGLDIRNNIFANSIVNRTGTATAYAVYSDAANTAFTQINNNIYYSPGIEGVLGYLGSNRATLADWRGATGKDANSLSSDPFLRANDDLQPFTASPAISAGTPVGVSTDFTGAARSETSPSTGAYETGVVAPGVDWANLQGPATLTFEEGESGSVYARVYEPGITEPAGQGAGIQVWIGYNPANTNPATWTEWVPATFSGQQGDNDEYVAIVGESVSAGTYYYASKVLLTGGVPQYGGYNSGFWDGTTNVSGVLTIPEFKITQLSYSTTFDDTSGWRMEPAPYQLIYFDRATNIHGENNNAMYKMSFYGVAVPYGNFQTLTSPEMDFTAYTNPRLKFDVAYRFNLAADGDKLEVVYTSDNGGIWNEGSPVLYNKSGLNLATYGADTWPFTPTMASQWRRETVDLSQLAGISGVRIGFRGTTHLGNNCFIDNVYIYQVASTASGTIPASNFSPQGFGTTGATIQFTGANSTDLGLTVEKLTAAPGGTLPSGILSIASQYWSVTVNSGSVDGTYSITFDVTGIPGIEDPATVHLLKRDHQTATWVDFGVPATVNGNLLTWGGLTSFSEFGLGGESDNPLPVELANFTAKARNRTVTLNWETKTEVDNSGFEVQRLDMEGDWKKISFIEGHGTTNSTKYYSFEDTKLPAGKHSYRLKQIDNDGTTSYSDVVEVTIDLPKEFVLSQNYPNPFNPSTKVDYQLAADSRVTIELYSISGEKVAVLVNQEQEAGYYTMMIDSHTHRMASGVYIYRMTATEATGKSFVIAKKLALMK